MAKKGQKFRKYTAEEKFKYITPVLNGEMSSREAGKKFGIEYSLIRTWVRKYSYGGIEALENHHNKSGNKFAALHTSKNLSEIDRLRLTVAKQEIEIERLKKGYLVKGVGANKEYVTSLEKNTK